MAQLREVMGVRKEIGMAATIAEMSLQMGLPERDEEGKPLPLPRIAVALLQI